MSPVRTEGEKKFRIPGRYLLLMIGLVSVLLMFVTFRTNVFTGPLNTAANYLIVPFQNGMSTIGRGMVTRVQTIAENRRLRQENASLRQQVASLVEEKTMLQQQGYELARLEALYEIDQEYPSYDKTGARIIARDEGNWYHSFIIDKGTDDGLAPDMNVMAVGGLVGRITRVGPSWARVESIISDNSNVSGQILTTSDNLMVSGSLTLYESGVIGFSQLVDQDDEVKEGDKIVTSNISDKYLPGILIGYVSQIGRDTNHITKSGLVTPAVDFEHLDTVLVIRQLKKTADGEEEH